jgi:hypothetical protein
MLEWGRVLSLRAKRFARRQRGLLGQPDNGLGERETHHLVVGKTRFIGYIPIACLCPSYKGPFSGRRGKIYWVYPNRLLVPKLSGTEDGKDLRMSHQAR